MAARLATQNVPAPNFSYASDELTPTGQRVIRIVERWTGQPLIRRIYEEYCELGRPAELFWADAVASLRLSVRLDRRPEASIPVEGPLIVVANHPFGVVDGLVLGWMVSGRRSDFQIMTHRVLHQAPQVRRHILPVDFSGTPEALAANLGSRRQARALLTRGGALVLFPGGGVATASGIRGRAVERPWGTLAATLAFATGADVLPVFFRGQNSRLFQLASGIHQVLKYGLLFHEVRNKIGARLTVNVGEVISNRSLRELGHPREATRHLKDATLALGASEAARAVSLPGAARRRRRRA